MAKAFCLIDPKGYNYYYVGISKNRESWIAGSSHGLFTQQDIIGRQEELNKEQEEEFCDKLMRYGYLKDVTQTLVCIPEDHIEEFLETFPGTQLGSTCVYLMREQNMTYYKVGRAKDPQKRLSDLQTGNPRKLILVCYVEVQDGKKEKEVQEKLKEYQANLGGGTEWFNLDTELKVNKAIKLIKDLSKNPADFAYLTE